MGRRIWVVVPQGDGIPEHLYDVRVLSFTAFYPAGPVGDGEPSSHGGHRAKHLVKLWTDPGGTRVLSVGSIRLKDPRKVAAAIRRHADATAAAAQ